MRKDSEGIIAKFPPPQVPMAASSAAQEAAIRAQGEKINQLTNERNALSSQLQPLQNAIGQLQRPKCWAGEGHWVYLGPNPPAGAKWALEIPIVCNYLLKSPWQVAMGFDAPLISGLV